MILKICSNLLERSSGMNVFEQENFLVSNQNVKHKEVEIVLILRLSRCTSACAATWDELLFPVVRFFLRTLLALDDGARVNICCVVAKEARTLVPHSLLSHIMSPQDAEIGLRGDRCPTLTGIVSFTVLGVLFYPFSIHKHHKIISISSVWVLLKDTCFLSGIYGARYIGSCQFHTTLNVFLPVCVCLCARETRHKRANEWRGREGVRKREVCGMGGGHLWDECRLLEPSQ